jgi:cysteinyl-tRNA synthetase
MPLRLHNTLGGTLATFVPLEPGPPYRVTFYTCGPTVYDFAHIGNFRSFLGADVLRRWLESPLCARVDAEGRETGGYGYRVVHVMNITDVGHMVDDTAADGGGEDKMDAARKRLLQDKKAGKLPAGVELDATDPYAIADFYAEAFLEDARVLGVKVVEDAAAQPEVMPRPTRMIRQMVEMIVSLLERGHAYIGGDGVAYFDTQSFADYGRLSGNTLDRIRSGAGGRVSAAVQSAKKHPADFMLWKPDATHLMRWDPSVVVGRKVPLGEGYPGWHIECSAMARAIRGDEIDLHSGGEDNIFPHHECEIAQSRCATGRAFFARHWFHPRFLMVEGEKMSKSRGTFFTVRDVLGKGFSAAALRLELIKTHYRSNANFTEQGLVDSGRMVARWREFVGRGGSSGVEGSRADAVAREFAEAMNDDLNVARALGAINAWMGRTPEPTRADAELMRVFDGTLGVLERADAGVVVDPDAARIEGLIVGRREARARKDFAEADRIRKELDAMGVVVTDTAAGTTWIRKAAL